MRTGFTAHIQRPALQLQEYMTCRDSAGPVEGFFSSRQAQSEYVLSRQSIPPSLLIASKNTVGRGEPPTSNVPVLTPLHQSVSR